jgi:hypothetical protein
VLKSYVWWNHERGSVHYDVMVTLILAFIFLTPRFFNYGDRPKPEWPQNEVRIAPDSSGGLLCEVPIGMVQKHAVVPTTQELQDAIAPAAGSMVIERWEPVHEVGGRVIGWRVWAHRGS